MSDIKPGYTRVSSILGQWNKYCSVPKDVLQAKADLGTSVHDHIEARSGGCMTVPDIFEAGYVESWEKWISMANPSLIYTELRLEDDSLKITGKFDAIVQFPGSEELVLIDYKNCASPLHMIWALQGNFYHHLAKLNGIEVSDRILFLQLNKDGKMPKVHEYKASKETWSICLAAYHCYRYMNS